MSLAAEDGLRDFIQEYATRLQLPKSHAVRRLVLLGIKYEMLANAGEVRVTRKSELLSSIESLEALVLATEKDEDKPRPARTRKPSKSTQNEDDDWLWS